MRTKLSVRLAPGVLGARQGSHQQQAAARARDATGNVEQLQTSTQTDSDAPCSQVDFLRKIRKQCRCESFLRPPANGCVFFSLSQRYVAPEYLQ